MAVKSPETIAKLYSANATVVWNGNVVKENPDKLMEFYTNLPSSEHTLYSLDCQPVTGTCTCMCRPIKDPVCEPRNQKSEQFDQAIPGRTTILVVVEGCVKFEGHKSENFSQNFLLTVEGGVEGPVWRVASDCFRFIE
ncbi:hypothetical protein QZH41_016466 [Actinostola sp. cb2023]|nr:hypothetical protein QZH41_016466 [Actinostola sp. cb2023]